MAFKANFFSLFFLLISFAVYIYCDKDKCPNKPCNENMPALTKDEELELDLYYEIGGPMVTGRIIQNICDLHKECGDKIKFIFKPGAKFKVVNEKLECGDICELNRKEACNILLDPDFATSCKEAAVSEEDIESCVTNKKSDGILIENGLEWATKSVTDACIPAVTFNGNLDYCASYDVYEVLKEYVCDLYGDSLSCCSEKHPAYYEIIGM